jgi:hypothetical protein
MKFYFTCPIVKEEIASDDYSLQEGHRIAEDEHGEKNSWDLSFLIQGVRYAARNTGLR